MNSSIIPQGPTETIAGGTMSRVALVVSAETDVVISAIIYDFPAAPPNASVVAAFTLKAGRNLFNVRSMTFTGTATAIYRY